MKFDIVVGNPPYQYKTTTVYQEFIDKAINLNASNICMIVKNNWMTSETLQDIRNKMIKTGISKIIDYPITEEIFNGARVAVSIFHLCKNNDGITEIVQIKHGKETSRLKANIGTLPIIVSNSIELSILEKVSNDIKNNSFGQYLLPTEPFRIANNFTVGRGQSAYGLETKDTESEEFNVKIACMNDGKLSFRYIREDDIPLRKECLRLYKVISGCKINSTKNVISNLHVIDNMSVCTGSFAVIFSDSDIKITNNALKYIQTKFFRFMVLLLCDNDMTTISRFRFSLVPLQNLDIEWTDEMLYSKYKLTTEEINYIEQLIN